MNAEENGPAAFAEIAKNPEEEKKADRGTQPKKNTEMAKQGTQCRKSKREPPIKEEHLQIQTSLSVCNPR